MNASERDEPISAPAIHHADGRAQQGHVHSGGEIALPIPRGGTIEQCRIDHALTLIVDFGYEGPSWTIRIEDDFYLTDRSGPGEWIRIHEGTRPGDVNRPINSLLHREVVSAMVGDDGSLHLTCDDDVGVEIVAGTHYEAWQIIGGAKESWVGGPDGTVSIIEPLV